jgi:peptide/nickel transport system permease protein
VTVLPFSQGSLLEAASRRLRRRAVVEQRWTTATLVAGTVIAFGIPIFAFLASLRSGFAPNRLDFSATLQAPSWTHPFGTDDVGRDVFTRSLAAVSTDYRIAIITTVVPLVIGIILGILAGVFRGFIEAVIMRMADVIMAFPLLVFIIAAEAALGAGVTGVYVGLIVFGWAVFARITRAEMLVLREQTFMKAVETMGLPRWRILLFHAFPNLLRPNLAYTMATLILNILTLATLSFLGLGVQPPTPELGAIIASGQPYLLTAWWISTLPGVLLVLIGIGFSLLGDGIDERIGRIAQLSQ